MPSDSVFPILLEPSGACFSAMRGETLLAAAERAGIALPNSCRNGTCRTCICRVGAGVIRHLVEWPGLSADEKREGYVLPCVACAETGVTLEAPAARAAGGTDQDRC